LNKKRKKKFKIIQNSIESNRMEQQVYKKVTELINLTGKCAIVTGGSQGIGAGISFRLAEAGASVMIAGLNEEKAKKQAEKIIAAGGKASYVQVNVCKLDDIQRAIHKTIETFSRIDILVNNAGIFPCSPSTLTTTPEFWNRMMETNLTSVFQFSQEAAKWMKENGVHGSIINISSVAGLKPEAMYGPYCVSKAGVDMISKCMALEFSAYNIRVNVINPGLVGTEGVEAGLKLYAETQNPEGIPLELAQRLSSKVPMKRNGTPDEIGRVALFLASDLASYVTGSTIVCDGGYFLS